MGPRWRCRCHPFWPGPSHRWPVTRSWLVPIPRPMPSDRSMCGAPTLNSPEMPEPVSSSSFWIEPLAGDADLDGVLHVEAESFTNPWTRAMYAWELQNRHVCHIYVVRTTGCPVAAFCAFWLVFDELH